MTMRAWRSGALLVAAAPGAGKTRPALVFARELLRAGAVRRIVVVAPTAPLTRQWAGAAGRLGVHLVPDAPELRPPRDFDGVAVTYARVAMVAERWSRQCGAPTLVIADEAHHLGEDLAWGLGFHLAFRDARRRLLLSGTPFRSDQTPIPGVRYDDGVVVPDVSYSYADAVRDRICRPVTFVPYDGVLQWRAGEEDVVESSFADALSGRDAARRYRTAISVELADGLPRILAAAHERLQAVRAGGHRDAGGLVVTADGEHARAVAKVLRAITGAPPVVVLHTEARAAEKLAAFTSSREPWIVAVNMVSEGVDIPRLRVGVYATAAKTPLIFRQVVGRFVRTIPGRPVDRSWLFLPADPVLRRHASDVETRAAPRPAPARRGGPVRARRAPRATRERAVGAGGLRARRRRRGAAARALRRRPTRPRGGRARRPDGAGRHRRGPGRRRRGAPGLGAPRAAARQAPPARRRPAPPRRSQPRRDQRLAQPQRRHPSCERRLASSSSSARSSCCWPSSRAAAAARRRTARAVVPPPAAGRPARGRRARPRPAGRRPARPRGGDAPRGRTRPRRRGARGRRRSDRTAGAR